MDEIREVYEEMAPALACAAKALKSLLESVVATIEDKTLVRAEVRRVRIKELSSVLRKAKSRGWKADQALPSCRDLVGGRVVCNNVEDVRRFAELLKEKQPGFWGEAKVKDFTTEPGVGGYRALHVKFRLDVGEHVLTPDLVPCEVQIRSRLQDAWAELSHDEIYKQPDLPEDLRAQAKGLAEALAAADRIASDIRSRVMRETAPPKHLPKMGRVSEAGLAFGFKEVFGRSPPDYAVRQALNLCDRLRIVSLEGFPDVLDRFAFRDQVDEAYRKIMGIGIWPEELLLAALYAHAEGEDKAIGWVRWKARNERRKFDDFAKREALCCLPETVDELIEAMEDPGSRADIDLWADALGASGICAICSTTVIQSFSFAESAVQHYEVPADRDGDVLERIETALLASGAETGGWGDGSLCSYHNEQMARDS